MKVENFIYRVSSRAHCFNIALDEPSISFIGNDGNGIINFSGMMISFDSNTMNLIGVALLGNEGKNDATSRLLLLISSIEIEDIAFYQFGTNAAARSALNIWEKALKAGDFFYSSSGYGYIVVSRDNLMVQHKTFENH